MVFSLRSAGGLQYSDLQHTEVIRNSDGELRLLNLDHFIKVIRCYLECCAHL